MFKREGETVRVFLIGDAASCANGGQKVPRGYYNLVVAHNITGAGTTESFDGHGE